MKVPKSAFAAAACCEPESARYALAGMKLVPANKQGNSTAIATDGRRMLVVQWREESLAETKIEGTVAESVIVPQRTCRDIGSIVRARTADEKFAVVVSDGTSVKATHGLNGSRTSIEAQPVEGRFPRWEDVLPKDEPLAALCLNAKLLLSTLKAACDAANVSADGGEVWLKVYGPDKPLVIQIDRSGSTVSLTSTAIVMPKHSDTQEAPELPKP